jgi:hypothetical protein
MRKSEFSKKEEGIRGLMLVVGCWFGFLFGDG